MQSSLDIIVDHDFEVYCLLTSLNKHFALNVAPILLPIKWGRCFHRRTNTIRIWAMKPYAKWFSYCFNKTHIFCCLFAIIFAYRQTEQYFHVHKHEHKWTEFEYAANFFVFAVFCAQLSHCCFMASICDWMSNRYCDCSTHCVIVCDLSVISIQIYHTKLISWSMIMNGVHIRCVISWGNSESNSTSVRSGDATKAGHITTTKCPLCTNKPPPVNRNEQN